MKTFEKRQFWQTCNVSITAIAATVTLLPPSVLSLLLYDRAVNEAKSEDTLGETMLVDL